MPIVRTYLPSALSMGQAAYQAGLGEYNKEASQFGLEVAKFGEAQRQFDVQSAQRRMIAAAELAARNERMMMEALQNQQRLAVQGAQLEQRDRQFYDEMGFRQGTSQQEQAFRQSANQEDWKNRFALQQQGDMADSLRAQQTMEAQAATRAQQDEIELRDSQYGAGHSSVGNQLGELRRNQSRLTPEGRQVLAEIQREYNQIGLGLPDPATGRTIPISRDERDQALRQIGARLESFMQDPTYQEPDFDPESAVIPVEGGRYVRELPGHEFIPDKPDAASSAKSPEYNSAAKSLQEQAKKRAEEKFKSEMQAAAGLSGAAQTSKQQAALKAKMEAEGYEPTTKEIAAEIIRQRQAQEEVNEIVSGQPAQGSGRPAEQPQPTKPAATPAQQTTSEAPARSLDKNAEQPVEQQGPPKAPWPGVYGQGTPESPFIITPETEAATVVDIMAKSHPGLPVIVLGPDGTQTTIRLPGESIPVEDPFNPQAKPKQPSGDPDVDRVAGYFGEREVAIDDQFKSLYEQKPLLFRDPTTTDKFKGLYSQATPEQRQRYDKMVADGELTMGQILKRMRDDEVTEGGRYPSLTRGARRVLRQQGPAALEEIYNAVNSGIMKVEEAAAQARAALKEMAKPSDMQMPGDSSGLVPPHDLDSIPDEEIIAMLRSAVESLESPGQEVAKGSGGVVPYGR